MALGKRISKQADLWLVSSELPPAPGHPFYRKLNELLAEAGFDAEVEDRCRPYYADGIGRPGIPPGVYFRMLFIGYFEGIDSQRGIAWRCADSRSLQAFLGLSPTEATPDHSSLTKIRQRLPQAVHEQVFGVVLEIARKKGLLQGDTVIGEGAEIGPNTRLVDCTVGARSIVEETVGRHADVGSGAVVGPYAVLEPGAHVAPGTRTGSFYTASAEDGST